jgi:hypothetical protein
VIKSVKHHRIQTSFSPIPDVPVSKFQLTMEGGKKGLLINSKDLCAKRYFSRLEFQAQNGKALVKKKLPLGVASCKAHKKPKKKAKHGSK